MFDDDVEDEVFDLEEDEDLPPTTVPPMTEVERQAAIDAFLAKGGKVKKCPTKVASDTFWIGGKPKVTEAPPSVEVV